MRAEPVRYLIERAHDGGEVTNGTHVLLLRLGKGHRPPDEHAPGRRSDAVDAVARIGSGESGLGVEPQVPGELDRQIDVAVVIDVPHPVIRHLAPEADDHPVLDDGLVDVQRVAPAVRGRSRSGRGVAVMRGLVDEEHAGNAVDRIALHVAGEGRKAVGQAVGDRERPRCSVHAELEGILRAHERSAVLQRLAVARNEVGCSVEVCVAPDVRRVEADRVVEITHLRAPAVGVELIGVLADRDLRRGVRRNLEPHAKRRRGRDLEFADFEVAVVLEKVVVAHPHGIEPAALIAVLQPLLHVIGPVLTDEAVGMHGDVPPDDFVRIRRRRLRIVVRLVTDPQRDRLLERRRVHVRILRALDVASVGVQSRYGSVARRALDTVGLREVRHRKGRRAAEEEQHSAECAAEGEVPCGRHGLTSTVSAMSACPGPHTIVQGILYVPAFLAVTFTDTGLSAVIIVGGIPRSLDATPWTPPVDVKRSVWRLPTCRTTWSGANFWSAVATTLTTGSILGAGFAADAGTAAVASTTPPRTMADKRMRDLL